MLSGENETRYPSLICRVVGCVIPCAIFFPLPKNTTMERTNAWAAGYVAARKRKPHYVLRSTKNMCTLFCYSQLSFPLLMSVYNTVLSPYLQLVELRKVCRT